MLPWIGIVWYARYVWIPYPASFLIAYFQSQVLLPWVAAPPISAPYSFSRIRAEIWPSRCLCMISDSCSESIYAYFFLFSLITLAYRKSRHNDGFPSVCLYLAALFKGEVWLSLQRVKKSHTILSEIRYRNKDKRGIYVPTEERRGVNGILNDGAQRNSAV